MENKKLTPNDLTELEKRFLAALRDPEIGPKLRAYIDMQMKETAKTGNT